MGRSHRTVNLIPVRPSKQQSGAQEIGPETGSSKTGFRALDKITYMESRFASVLFSTVSVHSNFKSYLAKKLSKKLVVIQWQFLHH